MKFWGVGRSALVALLVPLLLGVAPANAKKKHKKPKSPPVTVVSASKSTSSDNQQVTVTATCPSGLIAVGGGFLNPAVFDAGSPTDLNFIYESRRASDISWQASAVREDTGGAGPEIPLTASVDCRSAKLTAKKATGKKAAAAKKKKVKKLRITEVSASTTSGSNTGAQATATAACPPGTQALGGGFSSSPTPLLSGSLTYPIFWANFRASPISWAASFTNANTTAHTVTSYAYCAPGLKIVETSADVTLPASVGTASSAIAATPPCPKGKAQLGGGFNNTPAATGSAIALLTGSNTASGAWQVGAFNFSGVAGVLRSRAYCA
jgi:hypothetical protein